jgi:hypothetical protein
VSGTTASGQESRQRLPWASVIGSPPGVQVGRMRSSSGTWSGVTNSGATSPWEQPEGGGGGCDGTSVVGAGVGSVPAATSARPSPRSDRPPTTRSPVPTAVTTTAPTPAERRAWRRRRRRRPRARTSVTGRHVTGGAAASWPSA